MGRAGSGSGHGGGRSSGGSGGSRSRSSGGRVSSSHSGGYSRNSESSSGHYSSISGSYQFRYFGGIAGILLGIGFLMLLVGQNSFDIGGAAILFFIAIALGFIDMFLTFLSYVFNIDIIKTSEERAEDRKRRKLEKKKKRECSTLNEDVIE